LIILIRKMSSWDEQVRATLSERFKQRGAQATLARQLSARDQSWLSRYSAGEFSMDLGTLEEICAAWGVTLAQITGGPLPVMTARQVEALEVAQTYSRIASDEERAVVRRTIELFAAKTPGGHATGSPADPPATPEIAPERRQRGR
jgi:hypothetical protein